MRPSGLLTGMRINPSKGHNHSRLYVRNRHNPTLVRIRKVKIYSKSLICVQRLCRIEIVLDYPGVGLGRSRLNCICINRRFRMYSP